MTERTARRVARRWIARRNRIDKTWIEGIRKGWKSASRVPASFRSIHDAANYVNKTLKWVDSLVKDLTFNKGFWLAPDAPEGVLKDIKSKALEEMQGARLALVDARNHLRDLYDTVTPGERGYNMDSGRLWGWYLEQARGDERLARKKILETAHTYVQEGVEKADSHISRKMLRHLTRTLNDHKIENLDFGGNGVERELSIGRMKVVFQDAKALHPSEGDRNPNLRRNRDYVRYFDVARQLLARHGLEKVWYGYTYIQCKGCGGVNQHGAHLGVGARYYPRKDHVTVFIDPSPFLVELMIHELGHRYYYKFMTNTDRAEFDSYFGKVDAVSEYGSLISSEDFAEVFAWYVMGKKLTSDQRGRLEKFFKKVQRRASLRGAKAVSLITIPYLKKIMAALLKDPTGWGTSGVAYRHLESQLRRLKSGLVNPYPVTDLWSDLKAIGSDEDDINAMKAVRPPRAKKHVSFIDAALEFQRVTGKPFILRNIPSEPEADKLVPWVLAYANAVKNLKHPEAVRIWKQHVSKVVFRYKSRGTEDASWEDPNMVLVLDDRAVPNLSLLRRHIIHELGHALDDNSFPRKSYDLYGYPPFVTDYAGKNADEDFAETFVTFLRAPSRLRKISPEKYEDMASRLR